MISCEPTEERLEFGAFLCFLRREHFKLDFLSLLGTLSSCGKSIVIPSRTFSESDLTQSAVRPDCKPDRDVTCEVPRRPSAARDDKAGRGAAF